MNALMEGLDGKKIDIQVSDPLGHKTKCTYGILSNGTAMMEMAQAAGLTKLAGNERNPLNTTTYGVGEMIIDAMNRGCRKFVIGIGGSATNDGGCGAAALRHCVLCAGQVRFSCHHQDGGRA